MKISAPSLNLWWPDAERREGRGPNRLSTSRKEHKVSAAEALSGFFLWPLDTGQ